MANNPALFNAALCGFSGGAQSRWNFSTNNADYSAFANAMVAFATAVDAAIPTQAPTLGQEQLLQSLCQGVALQRFPQSGVPGDYAAIAQVIATQYALLSGSIQADASFGTQAAWAINANTGSDTGPGTVAQPLKTMAEFNRRMRNTLVSVVMTLALQTDVTDAPLMLANTQFLLGNTLTVAGTVTAVGTPTITAVTVLNTNTTFQLTTTGIVWAAGDVGKRIQLGTGQIGWVQEFIDANNVVTGPFVASNGTITTPVNGAVTVQTVSAIKPPTVDGICSTTANVVFVNDCAFTASFANGLVLNNGLPLLLHGCQITNTGTPTWYGYTFQTLRACFSTGDANFRGNLNHQTCTFVSGTVTGITYTSNAFTQTQTCSFNNCKLAVSFGSTMLNQGSMHWRNTASPITILTNSYVSFGGVWSGTVGITGTPITIRPTSRGHYTSASKPTITAGGTDVLVGTTNRTLAQIPYIDQNLDAIPPTVTTLNGAGTTTLGSTAYLIQSNSG